VDLTPQRARVALVAGGLWLLVDVLRAWTPSLITIFGRAAETPAELIGAFALAVCGLPLVLTLVVPRSERVATVALAGLVLCRVVLAFTDGDRPQLVVASAGTAFGILWLAVTVGRHAAALAPGIAWGLLLATAAHAALGTYGAVWRRDVWGNFELVASVALVAFAALRVTDEPVRRPGRVAAWLVFPVLLLAGVLFSNAGRASAMLGDGGPVLAVAGAFLGVLAVSAPRSRPATLAAGVVLVGVTAAGMLVSLDTVGPTPTDWLPFLLGAPAASYLLAGTVTEDAARGGPSAVAAGAVVWVVLLFGYYAGYDLGYRADWMVVGLAVVVGGVAVASGRRQVGPAGRRTGWWQLPPVPLTAAVTAVLLALVGPLVTLRPIAGATTDTGVRVRVAAYNLRMGYGIDGRFDARAVADLLLREHVDVVLLSEIDRGWLLNGGQDQLRILSRLTGMHAAFGPAADPVWGDAILSRVPLTDVERHRFPSYGAVTGAGALQASLQWGGLRVTVIATHLQPGADGTDDTVRQAGDLAALMRRAVRDRPGAVLAGGDLNTTPGSEAWRALRLVHASATDPGLGGLSDSLEAVRPLLTSSSDDLTEEIDHVFASHDLYAIRARTVRTELSDHLPVLVDLIPLSRVPKECRPGSSTDGGATSDVCAFTD
jgi:endonuclease/exonuclease/phosphatase family metal-dependent hydrolase